MRPCLCNRPRPRLVPQWRSHCSGFHTAVACGTQGDTLISCVAREASGWASLHRAYSYCSAK